MKMKRLALVLALVMAFSLVSVAAQAADPAVETAVSSWWAGLPSGFAQIKEDQLAQQLEFTEPFLLDVREPSEFEGGYIAGAVNIPIRTIGDNLSQLPESLNTPIIVYCAAGTRGNLAMAGLQILGYTNVKNLSGGFKAWAAAGNPVAK